MAASFALTLDTTAPQASLGAGSIDNATRILTVPYSVNESGVIAAQFIGEDDVVTPLGITETELIGQLPENAPPAGVVRVYTRDSVLNLGMFDREITRTVSVIRAISSAIARFRAVLSVHQTIGSVTSARLRYTANQTARSVSDA